MTPPNLPPCAGLSNMFDSRHLEDHREIRHLCAGCGLRDDCAPGPHADGTWAGVLYLNGKPATRHELDAVRSCPCGAPLARYRKRCDQCRDEAIKELRATRCRTEKEAAACPT